MTTLRKGTWWMAGVGDPSLIWVRGQLAVSLGSLQFLAWNKVHKCLFKENEALYGTGWLTGHPLVWVTAGTDLPADGLVQNAFGRTVRALPVESPSWNHLGPRPASRWLTSSGPSLSLLTLFSSPSLHIWSLLSWQNHAKKRKSFPVPST